MILWLHFLRGEKHERIIEEGIKKHFIFMTSLLFILIGVGVIQEIVKNLKPFEDVPVVSVETKDENKNQGSEVLKKPVNDDVKVSKGFMIRL